MLSYILLIKVIIKNTYNYFKFIFIKKKLYNIFKNNISLIFLNNLFTIKFKVNIYFKYNIINIIYKYINN